MRGKDSCNTCKCCGKADETIRHMAYGCKWAKDVHNIVFTEWWGRIGDSSPVILPSFSRYVLCTVTKRDSSMDTMRRTLNHITSYFIWCMRCSIVYSNKVATPPVITANTVWKEFKREFFFWPVLTTPPDKDPKTVCNKKVEQPFRGFLSKTTLQKAVGMFLLATHTLES